MWRNPAYPELAEPPPAAPEPSGKHLITFDRTRNGRKEELRVTLDTFEGSPFVSLRVWAQSDDGQMWPVRGKGCSVRMKECAALAEVLARVAEEWSRHRARPVRDVRPKSLAPYRRERERPEPSRPLLEGPAGRPEPGRSFDEFTEPYAYM